MKTKTTRSAIRRKRGAPKKRLVLTPPSKRSALLSGTAIAAGVLAGLGAFIATPNTAFAQGGVVSTSDACNVVANFFTCAGAETQNPLLEPDGTFQADFGPNIANPYTQDINTITPGVTINAAGNSTAGNGVHFYSNSFIDNEGGIGLYVFDVGDVVVNIDGAAGGEGDVAASITGTTGILVDGQFFDSEGEGDGLFGSSATVNVMGHVEGTEGAGIEITNVDLATINNHTYASVMGGNGDWIHNVGQARLNNQGGLTAGLTLNGALIEDIFNDGTESGPAVIVNNNSLRVDENTLLGGGVLAGFENGLAINTILGDTSESEGAADVFVNNNGWYEANGVGGFDLRAGGLIAGVTLDGVNVAFTEGDVFIDNSLTRGGSIDLTALDPQVYDAGNESGLLWDVLPGSAGPQGFTTGIYGNDDGVELFDIGGSGVLWNVNGQVVGAEGDGVSFGFLDTLFIDNSGTGDDFLTSFLSEGEEHIGPAVMGGRIWGGTNGISGGASGPVFINNNDDGWIFGVQNGLSMGEFSGLFHANLGGRVEGYYGDGIQVGPSKFGLVINGGWLDGQGGLYEGRILGGDSAIQSVADKFGVLNLPGGLIFGDGDDLEGQAVMDFWTDPEDEFFGFIPAGAVVLNAGIAGSHSNPHVDRSWSFPDVNEVPDYDIDVEQIVEDVNNIELFAMTGGAMGTVTGLGGLGDMPISAYWQTASDGLIDSEGGALLALNINASGALLGGIMGDMIGEGDMGLAEGDLAPWFERDEGIMFGRIVATGSTLDCFIDCESDDIYGNTVVNLGTWFTTNREDELMVAGWEGGNILDSDEGGYDAVYNFGFTQTAFGQEAESDAGPSNPEGYIGDYTSFLMDDFFNGGGLFSEGEGGLIGNGPGYAAYFNGALSMTDGDADDETYIFGNFHGSSDNTLYKSYLAVDVDFGPDISLQAEGYVHYGRSDVLEIGAVSESESDISGSTGVIANKLNDTTNPNTVVGSQLLLATVDGEDLNWYNLANNTCFNDEWCMDGDTFFVSELSPDYVNVSGIGFVRDGLFMWGITEEPSEGGVAPDPDFYWEATWGPDAYQQPTLITAAQTAWYETGGVVEDHVYGNVFPTMGAGGAGADLSYPAPEVPVPAVKTHSSAIWGRVTGSWANRDTEVVVDEGLPSELTFDTGYDQDTYSLLAGLEFKPGYGTMGDSEFRLGVFGGYVGSHVRYDDYGASAKLNGPTVGGYAALVNGGFYVDAEVKGDFLSVDYTTPSTEVSTRATSVGVLANAGYRMESGNSFLEPIVSAAFVNTSLDEEMVGPTTITYSNGNSMRAGIGARVGTVMVNANGTSTELDLLGKVWNEFGDANVVTINDGMTTETFTDGITGVFGEVVGRATVYSADRSTSGFVSAGAKFGHDWTTLQAKAGVRQNF